MTHKLQSKVPLYGFTGGIASGKTTAQSYFEALGITAIDQDVIARQVVAKNTPGLAALQALFETSICLDNGELDRKQLRQLIFKDPNLKAAVEGIIHPLVRTESQRQILEAQSPYILLVSPLLIEAKLHKLVDKVIIVDIPRALQLKRLLSRDGISEELANQMLDQQIDRDTRLAHADFILHNEGPTSELKDQVKRLDQKLRSLSIV